MDYYKIRLVLMEISNHQLLFQYLYELMGIPKTLVRVI